MTTIIDHLKQKRESERGKKQNNQKTNKQTNVSIGFPDEQSCKCTFIIAALIWHNYKSHVQ